METVASWQGVGASGGKAEGRAHLLRTDADLAGVERDAILVARHATLAILPAFLTARAAVCETGGYLGHLAILARELGKPCVTGVPGVLAQLRPGERLRLDGGTGRVERGSGDVPAGVTPPALPGHAPPGQTPVLQFGEFSATFEPRPAEFTLELSLRTAALVGLPPAFVGGLPLAFEVTERHVLVATPALRALTERLADRFEEGKLDAAEVRRRYRAAAGWDGWAALSGEAGAGLLLGALGRYVALNRLTWLAALVKETLARRCRTWLTSRWPPGDPASAQAVFLDLLTPPGRSYILRHALGGGPGCVWSETSPAAGPVLTDRTGPLLEDAGRRRRWALARLERHLSPGDARRARWGTVCAGALPPAALALLLTLLMGCAWFTDRIGIYSIFGAFVLGAARPRGPFAEAARRAVEPLTVTLLLPIFFVYSGLNTHLSLLLDPAVLGAAVLIVVVAFVCKGGACLLASRLGGASWRDATLTGILMNARGLMELILINIGLERGIITPALFTALALMAVLTTFVASPLFAWVRRGQPGLEDPLSLPLDSRA